MGLLSWLFGCKDEDYEEAHSGPMPETGRGMRGHDPDDDLADWFFEFND